MKSRNDSLIFLQSTGFRSGDLTKHLQSSRIQDRFNSVFPTNPVSRFILGCPGRTCAKGTNSAEVLKLFFQLGCSPLLASNSSSTVHREKLLCFRMLLEHNKSVAPGIRSQGARIRSHGRVERYATDSGRKGYPRRTEDCVTDAFGLGAQQKAFSAVLKLHFGQTVQIKLDVSPLARECFPLKTLLQSPA